ncbi:MAG: hypothetical protein WCI30_08065 [Clostridia bacterium]
MRKKIALCLILVLILQLGGCNTQKKLENDFFQSEYLINVEDEKYFTEGDSAATLLLSNPLYLTSNKVIGQPLDAFINNREIKINEMNAITDDVLVSLSEYRPKVENLRNEVLKYLELCRVAYPIYSKSLEKITMDIALSAAKVEYSKQLLTITDNSSPNSYVESYTKYNKILTSIEYAINVFNDLEKICLSAATVQIALIDDPELKLLVANRGLERAMETLGELHLESQNIQKSLHNLNGQIKQIATANYYMGIAAIAYINNSQTENNVQLKKLAETGQADKTLMSFVKSNSTMYQEAAATIYKTLQGKKAAENENLVATYWYKSLASFQQEEVENTKENSLLIQGYASLKENLLVRKYLMKSKMISTSTEAIEIKIPIIPKGEITGTISLQKDLKLLCREYDKLNQRLNGINNPYAEFTWKDGLLSIGTMQEKIALLSINLVGSFTFYQQSLNELAATKGENPAAVVKLEISYMKSKKILQNNLLILTAIERITKQEENFFAYGEKHLESLPEGDIKELYQDFLSKMKKNEQSEEELSRVKKLLVENAEVQLEKLRKILPVSSGLALYNELNLEILYSNWEKEILGNVIINSEIATQNNNRIGFLNLFLQDSLDGKMQQIILDSRKTNLVVFGKE